MGTKEFIRRLFVPEPATPAPAVASGLYHYMREAGQESYSPGAYTRFHLRVEPDGRGMLLANATAAAQLSPAGVVIAKGLLDDLSEEEILGKLGRQFSGASRGTMSADLERVAALMANLVAPGDNYPIINLEDAAVSPYLAQLMAPLQADVPLAEPERLIPLIDRLWEAAIPHVTILTPADPNPGYLERAVERAEDLGMIAGVRGRATDLQQGSLLVDLASAGIDHVTLIYASADPGAHDKLCGSGDHDRIGQLFAEIQAQEVVPVAEIPLLESTMEGIGLSLEALRSLGITNVNYFAIAAQDDMPLEQRQGALSSSAMPQTADIVEEMANQLDVRFIWQPPVLRDPTVLIEQQVRQGPRCTNDLSVRVEPTGEVIPARGPYRSAGNLIEQEWSSIWNDEAFLNYRERVERPTRCDECPGLAICAADCPRKIAGWSQGVGGTG